VPINPCIYLLLLLRWGLTCKLRCIFPFCATRHLESHTLISMMHVSNGERSNPSSLEEEPGRRPRMCLKVYRCLPEYSQRKTQSLRRLYCRCPRWLNAPASHISLHGNRQCQDETAKMDSDLASFKTDFDELGLLMLLLININTISQTTQHVGKAS
jgi:hypothetical protein